MRVYFARHGESEANIRHELSNRASPYGLTEIGRRQAASLADALAPNGVARVYSSPLRRAVETAEILGRSLGVPVELADALREFDCGVFEGRSDEAAWKAHDGILAEWLEQGRADARLEGGESLSDLRARFVPFIRRAVARDGRDHAIVLVGHGSLYRCVLPEVLLGIEPAVARKRGIGHVEFVTAASLPDGGLMCEDWPAG